MNTNIETICRWAVGASERQLMVLRHLNEGYLECMVFQCSSKNAMDYEVHVVIIESFRHLIFPVRDIPVQSS